jgi:hypothetical protein
MWSRPWQGATLERANIYTYATLPGALVYEFTLRSAACLGNVDIASNPRTGCPGDDHGEPFVSPWTYRSSDKMVSRPQVPFSRGPWCSFAAQERKLQALVLVAEVAEDVSVGECQGKQNPL